MKRRWLRQGMRGAQMLLDALLVMVGVSFAWWLRYVQQFGGPVTHGNVVPRAAYDVFRIELAVAIVAVFFLNGVYRVPRGTRLRDQAVRIVQAIVLAFALLVIFMFGAGQSFGSRLLLLYAFGSVTALVLAQRWALYRVKQFFWRRGIAVSRVLVVGTGPAARGMMRTLVRYPRSGLRLYGCLAHSTQAPVFPTEIDVLGIAVPVLGLTENLSTVLETHNIQTVYVVPSDADDLVLSELVETCRQHNVDVRVLPGLPDDREQKVSIDTSLGRPVLEIKTLTPNREAMAIKRVLDIALSLLVLFPVGLIVMAVIAVLIKLDSPGPVFFRQRRLTRGGAVFWVYKFRSMHVNAEREVVRLRPLNDSSGPLFKMFNDPRQTRVGRWLRRASLDELPQVFNILRGEMSWVGPRPPLPTEVSAYENWQLRRLGAQAGLTCLWQVSGRSLLSFEQQVRLDLYYIENWSIWLDLMILLKTIPAVLTGRGAF